MRTMRIPALALCTLMFPTLAAASPTYQAGSWSIDDGGTYDASQFSGASVTVLSGTLNISPGANLLSVDSWFTPGGGPITMTGGQVRDINSGLYGVTISGGQIGLAGTSPDYGGLEAEGQAVITGGTFTGAYGNSYVASGSAVVGDAGTLVGPGNTQTPFMSTLKISGGTFIGGSYVDGYNPSDPRGVLSGYSLVSDGNTTVTGGKFLSPILIDGFMGGETDFIGKNLKFQSGVLSGLLQNGDPINVQVSAQLVNAIVNSTGTEVSFVSTVTPPPASSLLSAQAQVPEPTSVWIFGVLALLGLSRRYAGRSRPTVFGCNRLHGH